MTLLPLSHVGRRKTKFQSVRRIINTIDNDAAALTKPV